ncbi:exocyst complex component Sec10-domain-containing protein [Phlyctochytrium arcticum]|nr:exocyst complex component Sec10-domain-containing protein [Phlyctochytrium arcticum]
MLRRSKDPPKGPALPPKTIASLPPDLIIRSFSFLPVPDLATLARVSRRFKILVYNDDVYEAKLRFLDIAVPEDEKEEGGTAKRREEATLVELLSTRLKMLPGGHLLPGSTKYLETGTLWGSLVENEGKDTIAEEKEGEGERKLSVSELEDAKVASPDSAAVSDESPVGASSPTSPAQSPSSQPPPQPLPSITSALPQKPTITVGAGGLKAALGKQSTTVSVGSFKASQISNNHQRYSRNGYSARDLFKHTYTQLVPYFLDFRIHQKDSKVFRDYKDLSEISMILRRLRLFSEGKFILNADDIQFSLETTIEWFESMVLGQFERAYDARNVAEMRRNALASYHLNGGAAAIQLFVSKNPVFFDPTFNPSLVAEKLPAAGSAGSAVGYNLADDFAKFSDYTLNNCREQARLIGQVFPTECDALTIFVNKVFEDSVAEYLAAVLAAAQDHAGLGIYLHTLASAIHCCMQFAEYISSNDAGVPVQTEKLKDMVLVIVNPFTGTYMRREMEYLQGRFKRELEKWGNRVSWGPTAAANFIADQAHAQAHKRAVMQTMKTIMFAPVALTKLITSSSSSKKPHRQSLLNNAEPVMTLPVQEDNVTYHLDDDSLNSLISLEMCLHLMHANKEALGRVLVITAAVDKGKIRPNVEKVFCALLDVIGKKHLKPSFTTAIDRLSNSKLVDLADSSTVNPDSLQFFEMVHIADLIQQMLEVYYLEDVKAWIDEFDFLSDVVVEKKTFERLLDDAVANGMDKSIQVLVNQVEFILVSEQGLRDYNPEEDNVVLDLKPTKACLKVVECLNSHTTILYGVAEKHTMEVFFGEVGTRIFNVICKNMKRLQISQTGAMQLICDLNRYYEWATTLRVSSVKKLFEVLKEIGNLFLADGGEELRNLVHDVPRYQGALRVEEVLELLGSRTDYKKIQKFIENKECIIQ